MNETFTASDVKNVLKKSIKTLEDMISIGNIELRHILGLRFEEISRIVKKREEVAKENRDLFNEIEVMLKDIEYRADLHNDQEIKNLYLEATQKAMQVKHQTVENMSLLNQIRSFFCSVISETTSTKNYNYCGKIVNTSPLKDVTPFLISKKA